MPIGTGIIYNVGDLILSQVSGSGTSFLETKIAAATSSIVYFDSTARINSASLNSITVGTASYVSGSTSIITNLTASNISASGTGSFGIVGIGTTLPSEKLHVVGNGLITSGSAVDLRIDVSGTGNASLTIDRQTTGAESKILLLDGNVSQWGIAAKAASNNFVIRDADSTERFTILKSGGNVGIGTSSPASKLHISGSGQTIMRLDSDTTSSVSQFQIKAASDAVLIMGMLGGSAASTNFGVTAAGQAFIGTSTLGSPHPTSLVIGNVSNIPIAFSTNNTEKMRIASDGNVGIGTTSVSSNLHIYALTGPELRLSAGGTGTGGLRFLKGDSGVSYINNQDSYAMQFQIAGNTKMSILADGNVGIGTTTPGALLDVRGQVLVNNVTASVSKNQLTINTNGTNYAHFYDLGTIANTLVLGGSPSITTLPTASISASIMSWGLTSGNVGIGTTSPVGKLHVVGGGGSGALVIQGSGITSHFHYGTNEDTYIRPGKTVGAVFIADVGGNVGIGTTTTTAKLHVSGSTGGVFEVDTAGGTTSFYVSASGNVGIGTTVTVAKLQVAGAGIFASELLHNSSDQIGWVNAKFTDYNDGHGIYISSLQAGGGKWLSGEGRYWNSSFWRSTSTTSTAISLDSGALKFYTNSGLTANSDFQPSERMRINSAGLVGIGTTNPVATLQVAGNVSGSSFTSSISNAVGFLGTSSWAQNVVSASYALTSSFATTAQTANALNTGNSYTISGLTNNSTLSQQGTLSMGSGYQILATTGTAPIPGISFVGDTNTGIYAPSADTLGFSISGSEKVRIANDGNVGIGTTNPLKNLQINAITASIRLEESSAGSKRLEFSIDSSAVAKISANQSGQQIAFETVGSERIRIAADGNVGIGTTSPSAKLEVSSSTAASLLNVKGVGGNGLLFVSGSGLVGIGTTSPTQKLEVQGNIQAGNDSTTTIGFKLTRLLGGVRTSEHTFHSANNSPWYTYGQNLNWTGELAGTVESTQAYRPYFEGFAPAAGYKIFGFMNTSSGAFTSANIVNSLVLKNDGNVGIGTDSPIAALDVRGRARVQNNTAATAFYVQQDDGSNDVVEFYRNATSNFILKNNGNVGIGTTAPAAKLEITGSSNSVLLNIKSAISGAILYVSGSGAVGIGTSNVGAYTLQVSGSFAATTKSFVIEHPTKAGKKLIYGSLESPYHGIRLTGRDTLVNGKCKIQLPDYIYKLILHDSVNIQLTGIKCNKTLYVDEINIPENYFTIAYDKAIFESYKDYDFFWDFTAIRADVPELITEL